MISVSKGMSRAKPGGSYYLEPHARPLPPRAHTPSLSDISERPAIVARKTRLGDWEGDTVVSDAGHKGGLLTLVERKTQLAKITKLPRATARATQKAAVRRLQPIGDFVHTSSPRRITHGSAV